MAPPPPRLPPSPSAGRHRSHSSYHPPPTSSSSSSARPQTPDPLHLPEWQPDTAVKSCPICDSVFTWLNRRHHCRKCGRVICASCSPHRITIPPAFVVKPPNFCPTTSTSPTSSASSTASADLEDTAAPVRICEDCLSSPPRPLRRSRTRSVPIHPPPPLRETDYCPICHIPLPREAPEQHITACLSSASPSTGTGRMVVWKAVEMRDTHDPVTGEKVECVICFEEFEECQEIARLECLCRYHKRCIKSWFEAKGGGVCPVHAVHE